jgi:uncharacterized membrane protein
VAEFLGGIFASIFGSHSILATIIIAMVPVIELKGAIPVGMNADFWGDNALSWGSAFWLALLGSCLVVPILALIFKPLIKWLKQTKLFRKLGEFLEKKVKKHSKSIEEKSEKDGGQTGSRKKTFLKMLAIFAFVAVPLPLTGVWTGACVAVAVGLNFWQTCLSCILGNMVAGVIIATVCAVFPQFTTILFLIMLVIVLCVVLSSIIKMLITKKKESNENVAIEDDGVQE